jgi:UDP-N-acetylmuramoylalanine--D-glutamate ligase
MAMKWTGKKVVIVGAARQGLALAGYLLAQGARVTLTDKRPLSDLAAAQQALATLSPRANEVTWVCGDHPLSLLENAELLCLSGGVSPALPLALEAQQRSIPLSNDSQIFLEVVPCPVIGITGSAGKTTTTMLVGRIAQAAVDDASTIDHSRPAGYRKVWVGGNIGAPLISDLDQMQVNDLCVMELSSFQLELMSRSPQVAAILNITPNHLDRHGTMQAYAAAKARILQFQSLGDSAVLGRDDPGAWSLAPVAPGRLYSFGFSELVGDQVGAYLYGEAVYIRQTPGADAVFVIQAQEITLRGAHNLLNVMAACAIAAAAGLPVEAMRSGVTGFAGAPHRLEFVRTWGGADWYNDSIATAPERAMAAIRSFEEPLVLLAGGRDKNLPWQDFAALVRRRVDHLVIFGEAAEIISQAIQAGAASREQTLQSVTRCAGLQQAVQAAAQLVQPGDVVLLSPGGTSFDEFKDFEERGVCFAQWVRNLT